VGEFVGVRVGVVNFFLGQSIGIAEAAQETQESFAETNLRCA